MSTSESILSLHVDFIDIHFDSNMKYFIFICWDTNISEELLVYLITNIIASSIVKMTQ